MSDDPDAVVDHRPDRCSCCGEDLQVELSVEVVSLTERFELQEGVSAMTQHPRLTVHVAW